MVQENNAPSLLNKELAFHANRLIDIIKEGDLHKQGALILTATNVRVDEDKGGAAMCCDGYYAIAAGTESLEAIIARILDEPELKAEIVRQLLEESLNEIVNTPDKKPDNN